MKRVIAGIFALAILLAGIAFFAASESYVLHFRAEVVPEPEVLIKTMVKDPTTIIVDGVPLDEEKATEIIAASLDKEQGLDVVFPCIPGETSPAKAYVNTCTYWVMRITIENVFAELGVEPEVHMDDVLVRDIFSGEFGGGILSEVPVEVLILKTPRGQTGKVHSGPTPSTPWPKIELFWCVTGDLGEGPDGEPVCIPTADPPDPLADQLLPGESQTLEILVFTRLNSHGLSLDNDDPRRGLFQEFTTLCDDDPKELCYTLNSGARAYWVDRKTPQPGQCYPLLDCPSTDSIPVGTLASIDSLTLNTPIDFGTVYPGEEVRDHFELRLSSSLLADGTEEKVAYRIQVVPGTPNDISPYIEIVRDESEGPESADTTSSATLSEPGDRSDLWWVIFTVPDCAELPDPEECASMGIQLGAEVVIIVSPP